ncbi:MAG: tyrosine-type recombinase/integrase [Cytophagales bacterium]|nr:tyrosine-type recombinase/integrase [Cytophagales bacterium]
METYTYHRYAESFKEWLQIINYSSSTTETLPRQLQEFFTWLESKDITTVTAITRQHILQWYDYLKYQRKSQHTDTFLKSQTLNGYIRALKLFSYYLRETEQANLTIDLVSERPLPSIRHILNAQEIQELYQAASDDHYGLRDQAMLSVYYGCGLRSSEGIALNLDDVMLDKKLLYVRQGKGYKERYVPFVEKQQTDFKLYLEQCRPLLANEESGNAFFLGNKGDRIRYGLLLSNLKRLQQRTGNETLKEKVFGLHALRHSIATHLMQRGMKFDYISQFLGHSSLNSTQIYTHLAHEYEHENTTTDRR